MIDPAVAAAFLAALFTIEASGRVCVEHTNPKIHGPHGMSTAALADVDRVPTDVVCNLDESEKAVIEYHERYFHLTGGNPFEMALLHKIGPGAYRLGRVSARARVYMERFSAAYVEGC